MPSVVSKSVFYAICSVKKCLRHSETKSTGNTLPFILRTAETFRLSRYDYALETQINGVQLVDWDGDGPPGSVGGIGTRKKCSGHFLSVKKTFLDSIWCQ